MSTSTAFDRPVRATAHYSFPGWTFREYADGTHDAENAVTGGWTARYASRAQAVEAVRATIRRASR